MPIFKSLEWLDLENCRCKRDSNPGFSAPEADALTTRPARRSVITNTPYIGVVAKYNYRNMIHTLARFIYVSGFMSTIITLQRCLCVVSPLKAQRIIQVQTTAAILATGHVTILGGHHVIATRWRIACVLDPTKGQSEDVVYSSEVYLENKALVDVFERVIFEVFLPRCCVSGVLISTVMITTKLRLMSKWRDQSTSVNSSGGSAVKGVTLTQMLIGINILFMACTTSALVFHAALPFVPVSTTTFTTCSSACSSYLTAAMLPPVSSCTRITSSAANFERQCRACSANAVRLRRRNKEQMQFRKAQKPQMWPWASDYGVCIELCLAIVYSGMSWSLGVLGRLQASLLPTSSCASLSWYFTYCSLTLCVHHLLVFSSLDKNCSLILLHSFFFFS